MEKKRATSFHPHNSPTGERKPGIEMLRPLLKVTQPSWDTNQVIPSAHTLPLPDTAPQAVCQEVEPTGTLAHGRGPYLSLPPCPSTPSPPCLDQGGLPRRQGWTGPPQLGAMLSSYCFPHKLLESTRQSSKGDFSI